MNKIFSTAIPVMCIITFPIAGIVAETCMERCKVMQASVGILISTSSLLNILLIPLKNYLSFAIVTTFILLIGGICLVGGSCCVVCVLPFTADQLNGAFREQLSFAVYWMMSGFVIAFHATLLSYIPEVYFHITVPVVVLLCMCTITLILCHCWNSINTIHQLTNPYK